MRLRGETPLERRCGGGWRVRRPRDRCRGDPHSYERRRTYGPEPRRRVDMHGAALVRIPKPSAKSEAKPPRPFFSSCTATRVPRAGRRARLCRSRPEALHTRSPIPEKFVIPGEPTCETRDPDSRVRPWVPALRYAAAGMTRCVNQRNPSPNVMAAKAAIHDTGQETRIPRLASFRPSPG